MDEKKGLIIILCSVLYLVLGIFGRFYNFMTFHRCLSSGDWLSLPIHAKTINEVSQFKI